MYLAQRIVITGIEGQQTIEGPLKGVDSIASVFNIVLPFMFAIAGILLFFFLAWGGYEFLLSQGDATKVKSGQAKITSAIIGFILLVLSYILVKVIAQIFGLQTSFL